MYCGKWFSDNGKNGWNSINPHEYLQETKKINKKMTTINMLSQQWKRLFQIKTMKKQKKKSHGWKEYPQNTIFPIGTTVKQERAYGKTPRKNNYSLFENI